MIQHAAIYFNGFISYSNNKVLSDKILEQYFFDDYYTNNKEYLHQKYYANWLNIFYPDEFRRSKMGLSRLKSNQLVLKLSNIKKSLRLNDRVLLFSIERCKVFLFQDNLAVFSLKVSLTENNPSFTDISALTDVLRNTTVNTNFVNENPLIPFIEEHIVSLFSEDAHSWKQFNPHLKLFLNIDVSHKHDSKDELDRLLFELATISPVGTIATGSLYAPSNAYFKDLMENNTIEVFDNWKVLCLFDSTVRISVDLKYADRFNLWENDYYHIYIFALFIRFYLYEVNAKLANFSGDIRAAASIRNKYIEFLNDFDLTQISFKFLPDVISRSLLRSLHIETEMQKLEQKINRIDTSIRERQERRIEVLLRLLAIISLISIINDAWDLAMKGMGLQGLSPDYAKGFVLSTLSVILIVGLLAIYFFRRNNTRR